VQVDAVVLAGAANAGRLREVSDAGNEALIEVGGRPLVCYVIDALARSKRTRQIVVVGLSHEEIGSYFRGDGVSFVPGGGSIVDNAVAGVRALTGARRVLLTTSDLPLITPEIVDDFVGMCGSMAGDFYYPIVERRDSERKYPGAHRTYIPTREGLFTGGNLVVITPDVLICSAELAGRFVDARKNPLKLARLLGWTFVTKLLLHVLTVSELERKISSLFNCRAIAVRCPHPEVGLDVDKPEDFELVSRLLGGRSAGGRG